MAATVVIPSGAVTKLRTGLRTQAAADMTAADLANFKLSVGGQTLTADQFSFSNISLDQHGQLVATLTITGTTLVPGSIMTLVTPSGTVAMKGFVPAAGASTQIDVASTARALIVEKLQADGKVADPATFPAQAVQIVIDRLTAELTAAGSASVLTATHLVRAVREVTTAIIGGKGTDQQTLNWIRGLPFASGGGGGGGPIDTSVADVLTQVTLSRGAQVVSDLTFAEIIDPFASTVRTTRGTQAASDASFVEMAQVDALVTVTRGTQAASDVSFAEIVDPFAASVRTTRGAQAANDVTFVAN